MKKIICPVDFSESSQVALDCAVAVARSYDGVVTLLHVVPMPAAVATVPSTFVGGVAFRSTDMASAIAQLSDLASATRPGGVPIQYEAVEASSIAEDILLQTERTHAELIVMGTHGRSRLGRAVFGSVAERVLRSAAVPVLIVPPTTAAGSSVTDPLGSILCAVDFSLDAGDAFAIAQELARRAGGNLTAVHVIEPLPVHFDPLVGTQLGLDEYERVVEESAQRELGQLVGNSEAGHPVHPVLGRGKAWREILRMAEEHHATLIVVATHGRHSLDRLVFGSTTENIIRRAHCPVLVVRTRRGANLRRGASSSRD